MNSYILYKHMRDSHGLKLHDAALDAITNAVDLMRAGGDRDTATARKILQAVAQHHGVSLIDVYGGSRKWRFAWVRFTAVHLIHKHTRLSTEEIRRLICYKDHTAVLWALKAFTNEIETNPESAADFNTLTKKLDL